MNNEIQVTDLVSIKQTTNNIVFLYYKGDSTIVIVNKSASIRYLIEKEAKELGSQIVTGVMGITKATKQLKLLRTILEDLTQNNEDLYFIHKK